MTEIAKRSIEMLIHGRLNGDYKIPNYILNRHNYNDSSDIDVSIAINIYKVYCWDVLRLDEINNKSLVAKMFLFASEGGLDDIKVKQCISLLIDSLYMYKGECGNHSYRSEMTNDIVEAVNKVEDQKKLEMIFEAVKISHYLHYSKMYNVFDERIINNTIIGGMK